MSYFFPFLLPLLPAAFLPRALARLPDEVPGLLFLAYFSSSESKKLAICPSRVLCRASMSSFRLSPSNEQFKKPETENSRMN